MTQPSHGTTDVENPRGSRMDLWHRRLAGGVTGETPVVPQFQGETPVPQLGCRRGPRSVPFLSRPRAALLVAGLFAAASCGACQFSYFLASNKKEQVPAQYRELEGKSVAVVVWADQATLDFDPYARSLVARSVAHYLKKSMPNAELIDSYDVDDLQEGTGSKWESLSNAELCERLKCDRILRVDLLEYTTRASTSQALRKGRISATVNLYGGDQDSGVSALYATEVKASYPPGATASALHLGDDQILHQTIELFGRLVASKFYDHERSYVRKDVR